MRLETVAKCKRAHALEGRAVYYIAPDGSRLEGKLHFDRRRGEQTWRIVLASGMEFEIDSDAIAVMDPTLEGTLRIPRFEESHILVRKAHYTLAKPRRW